MLSLKKHIIYWFPVYVYMGIIFYFSSQSFVGVSSTVGKAGLSGELQHLIEYLGLSLLVFRGVVNTFKRNSILLTLIISGLYGLSDEIHQYFVPGRMFSFFDIGFDLLGIVIGIVTYSIWLNFKKRLFYK
jgi:VanZ family protein